MEFNRLTVKDLKNLARTRGVRGYSRLRRNQLINLLSNPNPNPDPGTPILDRENENIGTPILRPTIAPPPTVTRVQEVTPSPTVARVNEKTSSTEKEKLKELLTSLEEVKVVPKSILPELKALKDKIGKLYGKYKKIKVEKKKLGS